MNTWAGLSYNVHLLQQPLMATVGRNQAVQHTVVFWAPPLFNRNQNTTASTSWRHFLFLPNCMNIQNFNRTFNTCSRTHLQGHYNTISPKVASSSLCLKLCDTVWAPQSKVSELWALPLTDFNTVIISRAVKDCGSHISQKKSKSFLKSLKKGSVEFFFCVFVFYMFTYLVTFWIH